MSRHLEDSLQTTIADYLRAQYPSLVWWHTPNGMYSEGDRIKRGRRVNRLKRMGLLPGVADIIVTWKGLNKTCCGAIELKAGKNIQSPEQELFQQQVINVGWQYVVCRSLEDVQRVLKSWGVVA